MNKVIEATYNLIDALDKSSTIKNLEKYTNLINNNKEVQDLIKSSQNKTEYEQSIIKQKLYKIEDYSNYMKYYNELFYIVISINNRFKKLTSTRSCNK